MTQTQIIALIIFIITYTGIIFTRLPKVNIDRPSAAFFGAVCMILFGVLSFEDAMLAIDFNTIALLLGMMIVITTLQLDGFFSFLAHKTMSYSKNQFNLLVVIVIITGISSAFMVNDAVVLLFTPVIITICLKYRLNPVPYLIAEILASNVGSVMTITGNPQNMLIGMNSGISYGRFLLLLMPVAVLGLIAVIFVIKWCYPKYFRNKHILLKSENNFEYNYKSMRISVPIFGGIVILFFFSKLFNLSIPVIALTGGAMILLFGKIKPSRIIKEIDWVLLVFFASLFIVVTAIEEAGLLSFLTENQNFGKNLSGITILHGISLLASQVVSNVPYTVALVPIFKEISSEVMWLSLASSATLAGNATIIGAMANLIVVESAEKYHVKIGFLEFLKAGIITTLITFAISIGIIFLEMKLGLMMN